MIEISLAGFLITAYLSVTILSFLGTQLDERKHDDLPLICWVIFGLFQAIFIIIVLAWFFNTQVIWT
jgi:membrane protein DedA with SNARE-associated domain